MSAVQRLVHGEGSGAERGRAEHRAGGDGEIKGPGPFRSVALMVLKNFRNPREGAGSSSRHFPNALKGLAGTFPPGQAHEARE